MSTSGKRRIELERLSSQSYLVKFVLLANFKMNFNDEECDASRKNRLKQPTQFLIKFFESYL